MEKPVAVAVLDLGMTNKKVAIYGMDLRLLSSVKKVFAPLMVEGMETHDLMAMEAWFVESLNAFAKRYDIRAIAVSTHGATLVCADAAGNPVAPCVYYTHEPGRAFRDRFYSLAGSPEALQAATGTPELSALINPAKGLLFLSEKFPEAYARTERVFFYPQYWGMRFTGAAGVEGTCAGCHTYLWDWTREAWSDVAEKLGIAAKLPRELKDSWAPLGTITRDFARRTGLSPDTIVTMGIHDSNASLLPHLAKKSGRDFILNSTGSWCVLMHPQDRYRFEPGELGKVVFFNRSAYNKPIKTAIFTGGMEYGAWSGLVAKLSGSTTPPRDPGPAAYPCIIAARDAFILPELVPGSGQFPGSAPRAAGSGSTYPFHAMDSGCPAPAFMRDPEAAMATLNLSLAFQTLVALERAGLKDGTDVYIEGGFRANADYCGLLAAALPRNSVYLTDMTEATSFGAAMTAVAALEGVTPDALADRFDIERIPVAPMPGLDGFPAYRDAWMSRIAEKE